MELTSLTPNKPGLVRTERHLFKKLLLLDLQDPEA